MITILVGFLAALGGIVLGYLIRQSLAQRQEGTLESKINKQINDARKQSEEILSKSKQEVRDIRTSAENKAEEVLELAHKQASSLKQDARNEEKEKQEILLQRERNIFKKEEALEKQRAGIEEREVKLAKHSKDLDTKHQELEEVKQKNIRELERISALEKDQAKKELFEHIHDEHKQEIDDRIVKLDRFGQEKIDERAKAMLVTAIQRYAAPHTQDATTSIVNIPNDEIKGRIIGREGRNIKTIEQLTGVDVIIDETPDSIILSSFDAVRRLVAKLSLEKLIKDGRIQPAKIEEAVLAAQEETNKKIKEAGEAALYDAGIVGIDPKLVWLLGRLRFRTSYGQNVLLHSLEVCHIAGMLASELGADVAVARKGGLFHDIGKAVDHDMEGSHVEIGMVLLEKYGVAKPIIDAMKSHHEEYPYESIEARIVQAADAISASRPGARKDTVENYLHRLGELEGVANNFEGVDRVYAIQAGREVRVFVKPDHIDDASAKTLARNIANKIQEELKYPGEVKVTLIRETRVVEYAR